MKTNPPAHPQGDKCEFVRGRKNDGSLAKHCRVYLQHQKVHPQWRYLQVQKQTSKKIIKTQGQ